MQGAPRGEWAGRQAGSCAGRCMRHAAPATPAGTPPVLTFAPYFPIPLELPLAPPQSSSAVPALPPELPPLLLLLPATPLLPAGVAPSAGATPDQNPIMACHMYTYCRPYRCFRWEMTPRRLSAEGAALCRQGQAQQAGQAGLVGRRVWHAVQCCLPRWQAGRGRRTGAMVGRAVGDAASAAAGCCSRGRCYWSSSTHIQVSAVGPGLWIPKLCICLHCGQAPGVLGGPRIEAQQGGAQQAGGGGAKGAEAPAVCRGRGKGRAGARHGWGGAAGRPVGRQAPSRRQGQCSSG